ncbi:MAG: hypothetical protein HXK58_04625 [Campylobacter concisus]|nr:hypothetical protein [Campylobacter concisus]
MKIKFVILAKSPDSSLLFAISLMVSILFKNPTFLYFIWTRSPTSYLYILGENVSLNLILSTIMLRLTTEFCLTTLVFSALILPIFFKLL